MKAQDAIALAEEYLRHGVFKKNRDDCRQL